MLFLSLSYAWCYLRFVFHFYDPKRKYHRCDDKQFHPVLAEKHAKIKKGRLTPQERAYIVAQVGEDKMACVEKMQYMGHKLRCNNNTGVVFTEADLFKPELNIAIGAIYLGQLIDKHTEGDQVRLDKVIINYNRGPFAKVPTGTPEQVYKLAGNLETRNYIAKLAGVNGVMTRA